jgi:hypothetical protein
MAETDSTFLNRRELAKSAMIGSASLVFSVAAQASTEASGTHEFIDVRKLGAAGDGKTDDNRSLQH